MQQTFDSNPRYADESGLAYFKRIAELTNSSPAYVKKCYYTRKTTKPQVLPEDAVKADLEHRKESAVVRQLKEKYTHLLKQYEDSEARFDAMLTVKEEVQVHEIAHKSEEGKHYATPVVQLSDWHFEERVDAATINGLNEYNLDIAKTRWNACVQNSLKLVQKERNSCQIDNMILWLGGDLITGYIHEELEENNYLSPTQAVRFAKERCIEAIKFYKQFGKFKKITVVCNYGNHGRTTKKKRVSTGHNNSYEYMLYQDLADYFSNDSLFEFIIPQGNFAYIKIYDYMLRFMHGDTIKYGGGIGGLTVPLIKALHRLDTQIKADYNYMGHFHNFFQATRNCIVNGSGIGFSPYAQIIGASPEEPLQGFSLIDSKYGQTVRMPIFCR
jgi:hypothetical protein